MLFIGHTRFSLFNPGSGSWLASNGSQFDSPQEYMDYLYSDDRLKLRAEVFLEHSLPQIELATRGDHITKHIVAFSDSLPRKYQARLEAAALQFPFLVLDRVASPRKAILPGTHHWIETVKSLHDGEALFGTYRLDDDDILPVDYFDQMAPYIHDNNVGMQISLASGISALYENSQFSNLRRSYYAMCSAGLLNVCKIDAAGMLHQPKMAPHHLSDRTNPVILDSRNTGFLRLRHITQDGALRSGDIEPASQRNKIIASMAKDPPVSSLEDVERIFPALKGNLRTEASTTEITLPNSGVLRRKPLRVKMHGDMKAIRFTTLLVCSEKASNRNALISYDFRGINGDEIDRLAFRDFFLDQGVGYSKDPEIGFYRYLKTAPGRIRTVQQLVLPDGVVCQSVLLRLWQKYDVNIKAIVFSVEPAVISQGGNASGGR